MDYSKLIESAIFAQTRAYAKYSNFKVGAALLCGDNKSIYTGCNIENAAYPMCNCGERTAFFKAVSEGIRDFTAIAIVGGDVYCPPCGACLQVMSEFCKQDFKVIMAKSQTDYIIKTLSELLPFGFGGEIIREKKY